MAATLLTKLSIGLVVFLALLLILGRHIFSHKLRLALFFLVYLIDNLLIVLTNRYPSLRVIPSHVWEGFLVCNWSGKLYSIVFTLALLYVTRKLLSAGEVGLTLRQKAGSVLPCSVVIVGLAGWAALVGFNSPKGEFSALTLLYLALMPGLNEELVYRGYLMGMLNQVMPQKINLLGAWVGWGAVASTLLFSLLHGFWLDEQLLVHIDGVALSNTFVSGFIFAWLRERSGSLLLPVVAHGLEDLLFFLPRMG